MRVLHLISSGGMYGAEAVILNLSSAFAASQQGTAVIAAFAHAGQPIPALHTAAERNSLPAELVPCKGQADLSVLQGIRETVERTGADVVHAHGYKADIYSWLAWRGRKRRPALVSTCHNWIDSDRVVRAYGAADRWVLRRFDQVVAVSEQVRDRLTSSGVSGGKVSLIRNGVLVAPFQAAGERRAAAGIGRQVRVGLVGRLGAEKGIDVFLRAAQKVAARFPEAEFVVAGEGPLREELDNLIAALGLQGKVQLSGVQSDMPAFYQAIDLLVSASHYEGLPMALLEGMASGLPVVATRVGQVPAVVLEGRTGLLVPPADPDALADAMGRLVADPVLRTTYGVASQQRVTREFSAERMTAEYARVYEQARTLSGHLSAKQSGVPA